MGWAFLEEKMGLEGERMREVSTAKELDAQRGRGRNLETPRPPPRYSAAGSSGNLGPLWDSAAW